MSKFKVGDRVIITKAYGKYQGAEGLVCEDVMATATSKRVMVDLGPTVLMVTDDDVELVEEVEDEGH